MIGVIRPRFAAVHMLAVAALALAALAPSATGLAAHETPRMSARTPVPQMPAAQTPAAQTPATRTPAARTQLAQSVRETDPECYCWANGQRFAHGEQACIRGAGATRLATCDRVINVMSWSFSAEPCPES
jgi:hypothetical protein